MPETDSTEGAEVAPVVVVDVVTGRTDDVLSAVASWAADRTGKSRTDSVNKRIKAGKYFCIFF
jgi:hypothetical protein